MYLENHQSKFIFLNFLKDKLFLYYNNKPKMYKNLNKILMVLTILIVLVVFFVYVNSFDDNVPTCEGYLTNVYLYLVLALLIIAFSVIFIAKRRYPITGHKVLIAMIVLFVALFTMFSLNPRNVLINHLVWLIFVIGLSVIFYNIWRYSVYRDVLNSTLIIVAILVIGLTAIVNYKPEWVKLSWGNALMIALLVGIFAWVIPLFFRGTTKMTNYYKMLSAIFVFIFMMLILYDTKLLRVKAETCSFPNYPKDSLGLILDIINLFNNLVIFRTF